MKTTELIRQRRAIARSIKILNTQGLAAEPEVLQILSDAGLDLHKVRSFGAPEYRARYVPRGVLVTTTTLPALLVRLAGAVCEALARAALAPLLGEPPELPPVDN